MKASTYIIGKKVYVFVRDNLNEMVNVFTKNKVINFKTEQEAKHFIKRKKKLWYGGKYI